MSIDTKSHYKKTYQINSFICKLSTGARRRGHRPSTNNTQVFCYATYIFVQGKGATEILLRVK